MAVLKALLFENIKMKNKTEKIKLEQNILTYYGDIIYKCVMKFTEKLESCKVGKCFNKK
jgi:hypothetical protein